MLWWFINTPPLMALRLMHFSLVSWGVANLNRHRYTIKSKKELFASKTTRRIFIFGSGYSLNDITDDEWQKIREYDSFGFNGSFHLKKIEFTYLLLRAGYETVEGVFEWKPYATYALSEINTNPYLKKTTFLFPTGVTSSYTNRIIGDRLWDTNKPIYFYLADRISRKPHKNLDLGLVQRAGTLCAAISFAVAMKYDEIVLIGVDLYDNRYFWIPENKTVNWSPKDRREVLSDHTVRGMSVSDRHNTVNNGIVEIIKEWDTYLLATRNIKLSVYNKKSLLASSIETFSWNRAESACPGKSDSEMNGSLAQSNGADSGTPDSRPSIGML